MVHKIKLITNKGKTFDWFLNAYLNFTLFNNGIDGDVEMATKIVGRELRRIVKLFNMRLIIK